MGDDACQARVVRAMLHGAGRLLPGSSAVRTGGGRGCGDFRAMPLIAVPVAAFRWACRAIGIAATFHSLRHTHATGMLRANVHPAVVQQRLGHSTISTTIDLYSHVTPVLQARAAELFDDAFGEGLPALSGTASTTAIGGG